jgi:uncharacterized iron-regulated protein
MKSIEKLLEQYRSASLDDEARLQMVNRLIDRAPTDRRALDTLLYVLNEDGNSEVRLAIVKFLEAERPLSAIRALTKEMFDPDPIIRAHAAIGLADYNDARRLARSLAALFDALPDPATRAPAGRAIRTVTGRSPEKITISERERVRLGEHPETIWVEHYESLPKHPGAGEAYDPDAEG